MAGAVAALAGLAGPGAVARADTTPNNNDNPYFTLSMSAASTQNLADGQAMPFTVTRTALGTSAGLEIAAVGTGWCASDVQLPVSEDPGNQTFNSLTTGFPLVNATTPGAPPENCLDYVNSDLSAVVSNGSSLPTIAPQPNAVTNVAGTQGDYPTVSGQALAEEGEGGEQPVPFNGISVNCLPSQSCTFALAVWTENVLTPGQNAVYFLGVPVTFVDSSAGLACSSPADGQINSESPDRLGETITQLGIDACQSGYAGGLGLTFNLGSGTSDDDALCAFDSGNVDLAYSAVSDGDQSPAFSPANCEGGAAPDRSYVAIPIALNAVVLAHSANLVQSPPYPSFGTAVTGYPQLKITDAQFAQLVSNGGYEDVSGSSQETSDSGTWGSQLGQGLLALNPTLSSGYQDSCANCVIVGAGSGVGVAATSGTDGTTYLATRFLVATAPTELMSAPDAEAAFPSKALGTSSNFGAPPPAYDVQTYTGRSILGHYTTPLSGTAWWALTDAATAAATWGGLDDFALQSSDSLSATPGDATYVAPTAASLQAAAANMTAQPDGTLLPDPQGGPVDGVEPYPLTYVEYAIAPAQPLLNADCTADTAAETALNEWLMYLVSQGQKELPAGMAPLTSSLDIQAQAAIAKVGTATPACTPTQAPGSSGASPSPSDVGYPTAQSGLEGVTPLPFADSSYLGLADAASLSKFLKLKDGKGHAGAPDTTARAAAVSLAAFGKISSDGWALPLLGILILMLLVPGLVFLASRRTPRFAPSEAASPQPDPQTQSPVDGGAVT
ncbi:MAG TPA: hypothetical protein VIY26_15895 [Acidimicrobiales bacterium]